MCTPTPAVPVSRLVAGGRSDRCVPAPRCREVASEAAEAGGPCALRRLPVGGGLWCHTRGGRRCRPERPDAPRLHVHVHVFLRGLTAGVMTQPCCDQQLAGPQGSLSAVLGASTNVCSCLGKHLDVTAGRTVHACAGGRCPLHARCPSLGGGGASGFFASSSVWRLAVLTLVRTA